MTIPPQSPGSPEPPDTGSGIADSLVCPRCADAPGRLRFDPDGATCPACHTHYPTVAGLPCLLPDPALWRATWVSRLDDYLGTTDVRMRALTQEAAGSDLLPRTRARVLRIVEGMGRQRERVRSFLAPLQQDPAGGATPPRLPSRPEQSASAAVLLHQENLFRDWGWGDAEAEILRALVERAAVAPLGRLAVFGAGAGRLAVDVHRTLGPTHTLALDLNPLPFLVADRLLRGETVTLPEFPVDPVSDQHVVIERTLRVAPPLTEDQRLRFALIFADALRPPVAPGGLDTVLTPWFIDVAPADPRQTAAAINRALAPGGWWLNLGPLQFARTPSRNYVIEELLELVAAAGFELAGHGRQDVPYFNSPVSGSRRVETIFWFAARKVAATDAVAIRETVPAWVTDPHLPIPLTPLVTALARTSMFTGAVMSSVDGARSIADIAAAVAGSAGLPPPVVEDQLRAFFAKLPTA